MWLALVLACVDPSNPGSPGVSADAPTAAAAAEQPGRSAAPTRDVLGLKLGDAGVDVAAWLTSREVSCAPAPSKPGAATRWSCAGDWAPSLFPERGQRGRVTEITVSQVHGGPVYHLSLTRRYSVADAALEDLDRTVAAIKAGFGPPKATERPADKAILDAKLLWFPSEWQFADLEVEVALMRFGTDYWSVAERWVVPGVKVTPADGAGGAHGKDLRSAALPDGAAAPTGARPAGTVPIADVYANRATMAGQPVRVWGVVHKVTHGVFGASWYHLRDGTGDEAAETHDLTVTSQDETFQPGDLIVAEGSLTIDKNLGFGYAYDAIIEGATLTRAPSP